MSKAFSLSRVPPPVTPPPKTCVACKDFRAECYVPVGEASAAMCWLCAHQVVDHGREPHEAATGECECLPHEIYPGRNPGRAVVAAGDAWHFSAPRYFDMLDSGHLVERDGPPPPDPSSGHAVVVAVDSDAGTLTIGDAPKKRVVHCRACGVEGHYAKTCPTVRRGRC